MDFPKPWDDAEEEEENEYMYGGRDGLIFLVDACKPMFDSEEGSHENTPFETSMECCKTFMLSKIISSDHDVMSIVLFGTAKSANELNAPNITTMQNLSEPSAEKIKQLESLLEPGGLNNFERDHGHSDDVALSDALWLCQTIFAISPTKLSSQRVLLLTCRSDPHAGNAVGRRQALVRAADLAQAGVEMELLHLGAGFDTEPFYQELMRLATGDPDLELPDPTSRFEELLERVCRLNYQKRALCHLEWQLGPEVRLGVNLYNLVRKSTLPKKVNLDSATNEPVTSVTRYFDTETQETMLPAELCKSQQFGEKLVRLRFDEMRDLRAISKPGLQLLGFKPADRLKAHHHVKPSAFVFPDEALVKGSRTLFSALLQRCHARAVVPLCYLTERANATPKLVALHPQVELLSKDGRTQRQPAGFHVVYLPYSDAVRKLSLPEAPRAGLPHVALAGAVVESLRFRYRPSLFDNPRLQAHWAAVEALALGHDARRDVPDYTMPDHDAMRAKLGDSARKLSAAIYSAGYDPEQAPTRAAAVKREAGTSAGVGRPAKVAAVVVDHSYVVELHRKGKLSQLNVTQLKGYLDGENIRYAKQAKKADLILHLEDYLK